MHFARLILTFALTLASLLCAHASTVQAKREGESFSLSNESVTAVWSIQHGLRWQSLTNRFTQANLDTFGDVFELVPREGSVVHSSEMRLIDSPVIEPIPAMSNASRAADTLPGQQIRIELADHSGNL